MKLLEQPPPQVRNDPPPPAVIIPEARLRERRRRLWAGLIIASVVALGLGLGIGIGGGKGAGNAQGSALGGSGGGLGHGRTSPPRSALADVSASPAGWSSVPLAGVQVSVPDFWPVGQPGRGVCGDFPTGVVFLGMAPKLRTRGCGHTANAVSLRAARGLTPAGGRQVHIHGLTVTVTMDRRTHSETAYVAGMMVTARGPLAARVIGTLTHSPRSVVLGHYRASVPKRWRHVNFGGLSFSVPSPWATQRESSIGGCPINIERSMLVLSTARTISLPSCMPYSISSGYMAARAGMLVFSGPQVEKSAKWRHAKCRARHGLRVCVNPYRLASGYAATNWPGLLTAEVYLPRHSRPDFVEIGLSGDGRTPLAIFDSLRPAP